MIEDLLHKYSKLKKSNNELEHREFFNDLYSLDENKILEFIIRSECYRGNKGKYFWNSNIPLKVLSLLIKSNEAKIILKRYFEKEENVNEEFIKELSFNFPNEFYEVYRESKVYLKEKHFDSSSFLKFQSNDELFHLREEVEYIKKYIDYIDLKEIEYFEKIKTFTMEEILIHLVSYFTSYQYGSLKFNNSTKHGADVIFNVVKNLPILLEEVKKGESKILGKMGKEVFYEKLLEEFPKIKSKEYNEMRKMNMYSKPPE